MLLRTKANVWLFIWFFISVSAFHTPKEKSHAYKLISSGNITAIKLFPNTSSSTLPPNTVINTILNWANYA